MMTWSAVSLCMIAPLSMACDAPVRKVADTPAIMLSLCTPKMRGLANNDVAKVTPERYAVLDSGQDKHIRQAWRHTMHSWFRTSERP